MRTMRTFAEIVGVGASLFLALGCPGEDDSPFGGGHRRDGGVASDAAPGTGGVHSGGAKGSRTGGTGWGGAGVTGGAGNAGTGGQPSGGNVGSGGTAGSGSGGIAPPIGGASTGGVGGITGTAGMNGRGGSGGGSTGGTGGAGESVVCPCVWLTRADFDGDGIVDRVDKVKGTRTWDSLAFYKGLGGGIYSDSAVITPNVLAPGARHLHDFDLNHDSRLDMLVVAPDDMAAPPSAHVYLFRGQGDGTFVAAPRKQLLRADTTAYFQASADFNGDGASDILATTTFGAPWKDWSWVVLADGPEFTVAVSPASIGTRNYPITSFFDLDNDSKLDIVTRWATTPASTYESPSHVTVSFGHGDGTFDFLKVAGTDGATDLSVADRNADGKLDIVVTLPGGVTPFYADGARGFSPLAP